MSGARDAIAKAIRERHDFSYSTLEDFLADADAIIAGLAADGFAIVPANVTDEMVHAYQLHLSQILGSAYVPSPRGTEDVRASIAAAIRAGAKE